MTLIYLDYNCFQRGFDDPGQIRIRMEALACQEIFIQAEEGAVQLVWSFMHEDETMLCPFPERKLEVLRLATLCAIRVGPEEAIQEIAEAFQREGSLSAKDAIHLACASYVGADVFLTCDDKLIKRARRLDLEMAVMNPVDYVRRMAKDDEESKSYE
ncbi:MAG TPA: PIN domain-containing protein [Chloroflexi bacterium]|nr:PIN domain-containing protein [Chloroflexota bacterium]